jgi:hypothetical protein
MPKVTKAERIALHQEWEGRISEFQRSGLTRKAWCEANHISIHKFHYWFGKLSRLESRSSLQPGPWAQVRVGEAITGGPPSAQTSLSVRVGSVVIEVRDGYNPSLLLDVVKVLQELC